MKLKTLKDIAKENQWLNEDGADVIRAEAIKWIREIRKAIKYPFGKDIPLLEHSHRYADYANSDKWIMHFFNITEEELKVNL